PATPYRHARKARDRLLTTIAGLVADRRRQPTGDGLSRMLLARAPDGRTITDEEAVLEVHHVVIAGFIVYALMAEVMWRLRESPILLARCAAEVDRGASLARLDTARQTVMEAKRVVPLVPLAFGRAKRDFTCGGYRVPAGWTVYLALRLCNLDAAIYKEPEQFDHTRFGPDRAEDQKHPLGFIPQGAGPHRCLGLDYSTYLVLTFLTVLVRDYRWELPAQDFRYVWATVPPEPRDGMRVQLRRRAEADSSARSNSRNPA
ncbi:MAG: cytochrome P450, partial [Acidimicrobiales bacterium]